MMIGKMRMVSVSVTTLLLATALLSAFFVEGSVGNKRGSSMRNNGKSPTTNKAKLESMVREQNLLPPLVRNEDLPVENAKEKWQSLNQDVEFIPADGIDRRTVQRFLEQGNYYGDDAEEEEEESGMSGMEDIYDVEPFVYGVDEYDEYQQAWRLMGFIVDCNPMVDDDYYGDGSGSGDQGTEDGCARYILWAAVSPNAFRRHCFTVLSEEITNDGSCDVSPYSYRPQIGNADCL
jgi:hypothetical protein